jgi:hypothetical protein
LACLDYKEKIKYVGGGKMKIVIYPNVPEEQWLRIFKKIQDVKKKQKLFITGIDLQILERRNTRGELFSETDYSTVITLAEQQSLFPKTTVTTHKKSIARDSQGKFLSV